MDMGHRAPRGALKPCDGERPSLPVCRSRPVKLRTARPRERAGGRQAVLTTPGRASTVRWFGSGKRDGKVYTRNQRQNASQEMSTSSNLTDQGWEAARIRLRADNSWTVGVEGREATPNGCGVGVARPQGYSWTPNPTNGHRVNVGTILAVPSLASGLLVGGKVRCRPMLPGWGGGPVVVAGVTTCRGGRESRPQGEGVQRVRSNVDRRGGR